MTYAQHMAKPTVKNVPQSQPLPNRDQIMNAAGGYVFQTDKWTQLRRFLLLGTEGGGYYEGEKKMTLNSAKAVLACIKENATKVMQDIQRISVDGLAPSNSPALFALALVAVFGEEDERRTAYGLMPQIARTGTHLFEFAENVKLLRGSITGRMAKRGFANWYTSKDGKTLAYQVTKYAQREGWSHADLIRLSHAATTSTSNDVHNVIGYAAGKIEMNRELAAKTLKEGHDGTMYLFAVELAKTADEGKVIQFIHDYNLPREVIPTQMLNSRAIWEALLEKMPYTAMMRNLPKMTNIGMFEAFSESTLHVIDTLTDRLMIKKAKVHPLAILIALKTYESGASVRGSNTWTPSQRVITALNDAFYASFDNIEPIQKNVMLMIDTSGSMSWGGGVAGIQSLLPMEAAAAFAMVYMKAQPDTFLLGVDTKVWEPQISPSMRLDQVMREMQKVQGGGTSLQLGFEYATRNRLPVDAFLMITDSMTWAGNRHASVALAEFRKFHKARFVNIQTSGYEGQINDPLDSESMEVSGFSPDCYTVANMFFNGEI